MQKPPTLALKNGTIISVVSGPTRAEVKFMIRIPNRGGLEDAFHADRVEQMLRAAVRRNTAASEIDQPVIETSAFTIDLAAKKVVKNGAEVHLTPTEWGMLEVLARNRGKLVGREELLKEVWGPGYATETHYLRVYLAQLRRKLEDDPSHPRHLLTESGMGYRFEE